MAMCYSSLQPVATTGCAFRVYHRNRSLWYRDQPGSVAVNFFLPGWDWLLVTQEEGRVADSTLSDSGQGQTETRTTLAEVARVAGVNKSTASRALRDDRTVGWQTRERIKRLAAQLNYVPNASARRLNSARTDVLAFTSQALRTTGGADPFLVELMAQICQEAARHQHDVLLCTADEETPELEMYKRVVEGRHADGFILSDLRLNDPRLEYLTSRKHPHVLFGRSAESLDEAYTYPYPWIEVDNRTGARCGTEHLISLGHWRIAFIGGGDACFCELDRHAGYRDALVTADIPFDPALFVGHDMSQDEGYQVTRSLLDLPEPPTAIFAFSDVLAVGAMRAASDHGKCIGRQFSIMGFDGLGLGTYLTPQLTTLRQPIEYIGAMLVKMLIGLLDGTPPTEQHLLLQPELIIRASTQAE